MVFFLIVNMLITKKIIIADELFFFESLPKNARNSEDIVDFLSSMSVHGYNLRSMWSIRYPWALRMMIACLS
jgi:hypothetical protein